MRQSNIVFAALTILLMGSGSVSASETGPPDWAKDYAIIVPSPSAAPLAEQIQGVERLGAHVAIVVSENAWLGWVPQTAVQKLRDAGLVRRIARSLGEQPDFSQGVRAERAAAAYWADVVKGTHRIGKSGWVPPASDVLRRGEVDLTIPQPLGAAALPSCRWENCYMSGLTAVAVFFVESSGSVDPDTYTWTTSHLQSTYTQLLDGANFWSSEASAHGKSLTFAYEWYPPVAVTFGGARTEVFQSYEPITRPSSDYPLWVNQIMNNLSVASGSTLNRVKYFNAGLKYRKGAQRVYSVFVGYNPPGSPDQFPGGNLAAFAPRYGGPMVQMLYRNFTGTTFGDVYAHEAGHMFYACDEYIPSCNSSSCAAGCYTATEGPRPTAPNGNCEACTGSILCIMKGYVRDVCQYSATQIGW